MREWVRECVCVLQLIAGPVVPFLFFFSPQTFFHPLLSPAHMGARCHKLWLAGALSAPAYSYVLSALLSPPLWLWEPEVAETQRLFMIGVNVGVCRVSLLTASGALGGAKHYDSDHHSHSCTQALILQALFVSHIVYFLYSIKHVWFVCLWLWGGGRVDEIWPVLFLHISLRLYAVLVHTRWTLPLDSLCNFRLLLPCQGSFSLSSHFDSLSPSHMRGEGMWHPACS